MPSVRRDDVADGRPSLPDPATRAGQDGLPSGSCGRPRLLHGSRPWAGLASIRVIAAKSGAREPPLSRSPTYQYP